MGRAYGYLEKQGVKNVKPEWGPPLQIYHLAPGERPALLAELKDAAGEWEIHDAAVSHAKADLPIDGLRAAGRP